MHATLAAMVQDWLRQDPDPETRAELRALWARGDEATLAERFSGRLHFGTAGLRAHMGAGPMRMNRVVVRQTTLGLGRYVLAQRSADQNTPAHNIGAAAAFPGHTEAPRAIVGFDGRHRSRQFAADAARVLTRLGFAVWPFSRPVPTPLVGFAVKKMVAHLGVVITASHNAAAYNGYKVYWHNGAQIVPPHDAAVAAAIAAAATATAHGDVDDTELPPPALGWDDDIERAYLDAVGAACTIASTGAPMALKVAYTPLHGVGGAMTQAAMQRLPGVDLHVVPAQAKIDGNFPTVHLPNPEDPQSLALLLQHAAHVDADVACAHDADADRLAVAVRRSRGDYVVLSGDMLGALLADACLHAAPPGAVVATTVVSSRLLQRMAEAAHVDYFETLTGFKWITTGALCRKARGQHFLFGYEEALGYILGDVVWDKDGVAAMRAVSILAQNLKARGQTLLQRLEEIWRAHGLFLSAQQTLAIDAARRQSFATQLRHSPPTHLGEHEVVATYDFLQVRQARDDKGAPASRITEGHAPPTEPCPLPACDMIIYFLKNGGRIVVRPSGTEPKIKCYYEMHATVSALQSVQQVRTRLEHQLRALCAHHMQQVQALTTPEAFAQP